MDVGEVADAVESGSWEQIDDLLNENFFRYLLTDGDSLRQALSRLPGEWFAAYRRHRLTKEIAFASGAMQLLDNKVQRDFIEWVRAQEQPATRDLIAVQSLEMRRMLVTGSYRRAATKADDIHEIVEAARDTDGFHDVLPSVLLRTGQTKLHVGDLSAASEAFTRAHRWARSRGLHPHGRFIRSHLALIDALHGDFVLARTWLRPRDESDQPDDGDLNHQLETADLLIRAFVSVCSDSAEEAEAALDRVAYEQSESDLWWVGVHARALFELQWGDPRRGIARLEQALRNYRSASAPELLAGQLLRADLASHYQMADELDAAERVLKTPGLTRSHVLVRAAESRQFLLRGRLDEAFGALDADPDVGNGEVVAVTSVLRAVIEYADSGKATERTVSRAAEQIRSSGMAVALQEANDPIRTDILKRLDAVHAPTRSQYRYSGAITVDLSQRERQVLSALGRHESVTAIANELYLSVNTVKTYKRSLYRKLGARSRVEALEYAAALSGALEQNHPPG